MKIKLTLRSAVASIALSTLVIATQGCAKQTPVQVVSSIDTEIPAVVAAADTAAAVISGLLPTDAALVGVVDTAFDTTANTILALGKAYLANPTASTLVQIQTAITTLETQINAQTLAAAKIVNPQSQAAVLAGLKGVLTLATVLLALITPLLSSAQIDALHGQFELAKTRKYMDEGLLAKSLPAGITVDQAFAYASARGL